MFDGWESHFPDLTVEAVDLHSGVDVSCASMKDYSERVVEIARRETPEPVALCGWSMGGLVALAAARDTDASALVLIEPSPPGEVQGFDDKTPLEKGTFDPESVYGAFPLGMRSRAESALARAERKRGISVPRVPCPTLVISGDDFHEERGESVARFYGAEHRHFARVDHWELVLSAEVRDVVASFVRASMFRAAGSDGF